VLQLAGVCHKPSSATQETGAAETLPEAKTSARHVANRTRRIEPGCCIVGVSQENSIELQITSPRADCTLTGPKLQKCAPTADLWCAGLLSAHPSTAGHLICRPTTHTEIGTNLADRK
jgi:hypothetical protein